MQTVNPKWDPMNQTLNATFTLASGEQFDAHAGWCNNDGEKWTFDLSLVLKSSNDYEFTTEVFLSSNTQEIVHDALDYYQTTATADEVKAIAAFITDARANLKTSGSANDSYYGV